MVKLQLLKFLELKITLFKLMLMVIPNSDHGSATAITQLKAPMNSPKHPPHSLSPCSGKMVETLTSLLPVLTTNTTTEIEMQLLPQVVKLTFFPQPTEAMICLLPMHTSSLMISTWQ